MAPLAFSPTNSLSSHTLSMPSVQAVILPAPDSKPIQELVSALTSSPHSFLQPQKQLYAAALAVAKNYLDPLALGVSDAQIKRQSIVRKKRKRGERDVGLDVLRLKRVHTEGFETSQVWEQARVVLNAANKEVERAISRVQDSDLSTLAADSRRKYVAEKSRSQSISDASDSVNGIGLNGNEYEASDLASGDIEAISDVGGEEDDGSDSIEEDDALDVDGSAERKDAEVYVQDAHGLNDGFFSIDEFNRQTEFLEQQDSRGNAGNGTVSDDEDIDWDIDPFKIQGDGTSRSDAVKGSGDESSEDDEPTFGNVDLHAPEGASDEDEDEEDEVDDLDVHDGDVTNANDIMYEDFFAPPARKASKKKRGRPNPHNFPEKEVSWKAPVDEDIQRTISAVQRDLFEDSNPEDSGGDLSNADPSDPKSRRSTHERKQAKINEEIRRLEAANVAKREWVLSGEARATDRPLNSLLEEDLDFERTGKPVPVITSEVTEEIEAMIKRRILAREFDEIIRRRPDDLATEPIRRGRAELPDTKSGKSLAEIYEEEHLRRTDPNFVEVKDERLRKEHGEIRNMWKDVCAKLDSLSSWHYRPKPAVPSVEVRVDAPTITLEDARPSAGGDVGGASILAPQEVYRPGESGEKGKSEVITRAGLPVAKEEMSREDKQRRRKREKERSKKATQTVTADSRPGSKKATEKSEIVNNLKKAGVGVIGKRGEVKDIEGKQMKQQAGRGSAGQLKL